MYFTEIQKFGEICENSCSWPPIVMKISMKPIKCSIIL